jgi:ketosteroid isomerase-like protein
MSQENVDADFDVIRRAWRASGQKDLAAFERDLDPDIVTIPFGAAMEGKSYRGVDAVVGWLRDEIWASWEQFDTVPEEFTRVGDKVLVRGHWRATGKESGVELVIRATWVVEVRNGKIAYWQTYTDHEDALRDLGLGPDKSST